MGWLLLTVLLTILFVGLLVTGLVLNKNRNKQLSKVSENRHAHDELPTSGTPFLLGSILAPAAWLLLTGLMSFHQVPVGNIGVVYQFGSIVNQIPEGAQFIAPWQDVNLANIQIQKQTFEFVAFSSESQDVPIKASVNYNVNPEAIQSLYRTVGPNYFQVLVESRVLQNFKDETVKYAVFNIAPNRETIRRAVVERLKLEMAPYSINIVDVLVDNIDISPELKKAVEAKQVANQDALTAKERVTQKEYEAQQVVKTAEGEANRKREEARGNADALRTTADAQAYANKVLAASLTPELIQFQALQKLADNIQIALIPSGEGLIIDPSTLLDNPKDETKK